MKLRYAPTAAAELDALLLSYLGERSPRGAVRVGASIRRAEQTLIAHPYVGTLTTAHQPPVRRFLLRAFPYILFHELGDGEISIIGVRHAARDPASMPDAL